ncbi:MAG: hypothetical protein ACP5N1_00050 [Candidatus Woesearchaeota archaeon]
MNCVTRMNYRIWQIKTKFNEDLQRLIKHLFYQYDFYNYDYDNASLDDKLDLKLPRIKKDIFYRSNSEDTGSIPKNSLPKSFEKKMKSYNLQMVYIDAHNFIEKSSYKSHIYADSSYHPCSMLISDLDLERNSKNISEFRLVDTWERQRWVGFELGIIDYSYYKLLNSKEMCVDITIAAPKKKIDTLEKTILSWMDKNNND